MIWHEVPRIDTRLIPRQRTSTLITFIKIKMGIVCCRLLNQLAFKISEDGPMQKESLLLVILLLATLNSSVHAANKVLAAEHRFSRYSG